MSELPRRLQLPGGRVAELRPTKAPPTIEKGLFAEALALLATFEVRIDGVRTDIDALSLSEFHALRMVLSAVGLLDEAEVTVFCKNCPAKLTLRPSASVPLGPFVDAELDDPELDATLPLGEPHAIPAVAIGAEKVTTVTFGPVTVGDAKGLFSALAKRKLRISPAVVRGLGIAQLGAERDRARIAAALGDASDEAFGAIGNLFLQAHYPLRLGAISTCKECGARNDVDAPYDREFEPWEPEEGGEREPFPDLRAFEREARRQAQAILGDAFASEVAFVIDGGVPACDDGGEPLLGSYVAGGEGDAQTPTRAPEITVYYRTFRAMWDDEGEYDWRAELEETITHELEHHHAGERGHDAVDEEERAEIAREARRVLGKKALARSAATGLGRDFGEFLRRTWPIWILALIVVIASIVATK